MIAMKWRGVGHLPRSWFATPGSDHEEHQLHRTHMKIRKERSDDAHEIGIITTDAFKSAAHSDGNEAQVVTALRSAGALIISLVATEECETLIGHIAFSPVTISERSGKWFALGPVSVRPDRQGTGVGCALVREGLAQLKAMDAEGCVVLGDPAYYQRFGFAVGESLTYFGHPNPYLQCRVFEGPPPLGDVTFHTAFDPA